MARGFYNNFRAAKREGFVIEPIICVHDSCTSYFPVDKLFDIKGFYDEHFTNFCREQCNVPFLFDLLVGVNYENAVMLNQIDKNNIWIKGNAESLLGIYNKLTTESNLNYEFSIEKDKLIPNYITNPVERFVRSEGNTCMDLDDSEYELKITRVAWQLII